MKKMWRKGNPNEKMWRTTAGPENPHPKSADPVRRPGNVA